MRSVFVIISVSDNAFFKVESGKTKTSGNKSDQ